MKKHDFNVSIWVEQTPTEAYNTILDVGAWWSGLYGESIEGRSEKPGDEFSFIAGGGVHYSKQILVESVPYKKVVWLVTEAHLDFVDRTGEWVDTRICFNICEEEGKTKIEFMHIGLVPELECYDSCSAAWTQYIKEQLTAALINGRQKQAEDFTTTILVKQTPAEVFEAVNNVRGWWSESVEGNTDKLNEEFLYYYKDVHISKMKIVEYIPNERIVWLVLYNHFNFTRDKTEWNGNKIGFDITSKDDQTELRFTQEGLVPEYECYNVCHDAWTSYIHGSLKDLITTGKGKPNAKEGGLNAELIEKWKLPNK